LLAGNNGSIVVEKPHGMYVLAAARLIRPPYRWKSVVQACDKAEDVGGYGKTGNVEASSCDNHLQAVDPWTA